MRKKEYESPKIDLIAFDVTDVIAYSKTKTTVELDEAGTADNVTGDIIWEF